MLVPDLTTYVSMKIQCHELKNARIGINALLEPWAALVGGESQCRDWTMPIVNGDREAKPDSELRCFIE